ncbi:ferredoxin [Xylocopilactobacillus apis]|uniref:4Fe-4S ferredoxin-type domain-containing protein n=1 Tax=Xylocopilactobacillus apis TaxID=2932183 RepID=A0AAU9DNL7_9LACO|nr:ferredoxin [Xylocopilactobacillus apis]BDR56543.1 hypothetical protein KIMC2_11050 [Xylocopilactobacillus apis]
MKLLLDSKRCIACGLCLREHPELFDLDDRGIAHFKKNLTSDSSVEIDSKKAKDLRSTITNCPGKAFRIDR